MVGYGLLCIFGNIINIEAAPFVIILGVIEIIWGLRKR